MHVSYIRSKVAANKDDIILFNTQAAIKHTPEPPGAFAVPIGQVARREEPSANLSLVCPIQGRSPFMHGILSLETTRIAPRPT